ncbi:autotransporter secretion inner membrane protein TamB [Thiohalospira halophila DSM 15071]|uniref:Autotransporter secretion inner membrane protein TamB n=1 Tax=Thiohalospira halophila DSM 15071 TaxID=1123397 RepID=A0A1I1NSS5_9GAMM|nr:translocation/assembly module TamB domain-containing protein [Thiohalospira halophila]SFD00669.1 autotransporter secretion inner membrane protein TamB [Thiohalospira halophila DSM 15071]
MAGVLLTRLRRLAVLAGKGLLLAVVLALAAAGVGLVTLLHHPAAPGWVAGWAGEITGGRLTVEEAEGRLAGPLRLEGVRWEDEAVTAGATGLDLDWRPLDLLVGRVRIHRLHVEDLTVTVRGGEPGPTTETPGGALPELPGLPFALELTGTRVAANRLPGLEGPLHLRLAARAGGSRLRDLNATLRHRGARLALVGEGDWRQRALEARLQIDTPSPLGPATGHLDLAGDTEELRVEGRGSGPARVRLEGRLRSLLEDPTLDLTLRADRPGPALQERAGFPWLGRVTADVTGPAATPAMTLAARLDLAENGLWALEAEGRRGADGWLHLPALALERLDAGGGAVTGSGAWHLGEGRGTATLASDGLALPRDLGRLEGLALQAGGTPSHWDLTGTVAARPADLPEASARLRARGAGATLHTELRELEALGGSAHGRATLTLEGERPWQADLAWEGVETGGLLPDWPATLTGETRLHGTLTGPTATMKDLHVAGDLRGHDLAVDGRGAWTSDGWRVAGLDASVGANHLAGHASGSTPLTADLRLDLSDPEALHPELHGRLEGRIGWADGSGDARLTGTDLAWGDLIAIPQLQVSAEGSPAHLRAGLTLPTAEVANQQAGAVSLILEGPPERLNWTLAAGRPRLALTGTLEPAAGELRATTGVATAAGENWQLAGHLRARQGADGWGLESGCWLGDAGGRLCAGAHGDAEGGTAALELAGLELAPLARLIPGGTRLHAGQLDSRARLRWSDAIDELALAAEARGLELVHPRLDDEIAARLERLDLRADYTAETGLTAGTTLHTGEPGDEFAGRVHLPEWRWAAVDADQPLEGAMHADRVGVAWIGPLVPGFIRTDGHLAADIALTGTLGEPLPQGAIHWREGRLRVADAGLDLRPVTATIRANGAEPLQLEAQARSGGGTLDLAGTFQPRPPMTADLRLTGQGVQVVDLPEARVQASPDLRLELTPEEAIFTGEVRLPEARLVLPEGGGASGAAPSPDVVYREAGEEEAGLPVRADIRLLLGPRIYLRGHGFRGRLEGDLRLLQEPGSPPRGRGELVIQDGHYRAWGQELTIDNGRLLFADTPVDNPGLDLRAERPGLPVTAGVHVGGRLRDPNLALYSDPAMEDSEILSWVVLGRPLESASGEEGASLAAAATALQLAGGNRLATQLGDRFGIDEVGIASGTTADSAALVLGTWLSPRLYVRYAIGLTEDINTLRTRYLLDDQWTLEAETGEASGIDLLWSIER